MTIATIDPRIDQALRDASGRDEPYQVDTLLVNDDVPLWHVWMQDREIVTHRAIHDTTRDGVEAAERLISSAALAPLIGMQLSSHSLTQDVAGDVIIVEEGFEFRVRVGGRMIGVSTETQDAKYLSMSDDDHNSLSLHRTRVFHDVLRQIDAMVLRAEDVLAYMYPTS